MAVRLPTLVEYESTELALTDRQASRLAATGVVDVTTLGRGTWRVTATSTVGTLVIDDLELLIRPKIRPENLFLLLEVGLPESAWRREAFDYATTKDLLPSVVGFFARTVETTLARGVLRSYRGRHEPVVSLRGRIDMPAQLRRTGIATPVACRFDEYTADNAENRYLRGAIRRALRVARVAPADRRRLLQQLVALEDVEDTPTRADDLDRITRTRLSAHYQPALHLARVLLESLTLVDQRGGATASSFLVDMNKLFERFVTERLRRALRGRLEIRAEPPVHLGAGRQVLMYPDLEFRRRGSVAYVGDVKYKLTADAKARNADYYQLLAYTTALDLPEGVLIYCLADGGRPERSVTVQHAGKVLHTRAIDLTGPASSVAQEIGTLADWIVARASSLGVATGAGIGR
jgi:5-methylcytosine-specific restriction enzyme subunit McrC